MVNAEHVSLAGDKYLGTPYSEMDCQAFVEKCLADCGCRENLPGSNAWFRKMTWTGTPEECKAKFGTIPRGAFLFILEHNDNEPEKYKGDGIGNASHIGIYTGRTAQAMLRDYATAPDGLRQLIIGKALHGDGAIHSSSTRGCVATSAFSGKSIRGGWNRVGLWNKLSYGEKIDRLLAGTPSKEATPMQPTITGSDALVTADNGKSVNVRAKPGGAKLAQLPVGTQVTVMQIEGEWARVDYHAQGWMMVKYLTEAGEGVG